jgi:hypothetical protein
MIKRLLGQEFDPNQASTIVADADTRVFLEQTEKLTSLALLNDEITMGDIADAVKMHYTALPRKMFGDVQLPRNKSVDPKRLSPI